MVCTVSLFQWHLTSCDQALDFQEVIYFITLIGSVGWLVLYSDNGLVQTSEWHNS